jgi:hypothetical protein
MRILHLDSGRQMRGGQWQVLHLLRALREAGHEPLLLARPGTILAAEAKMLGIAAGALSWRSVRAWSNGSDLLHCHDAHSHTLAALLSKRPFVVSRRVAFPLGKGPLSRQKYARAAHYLAVSHAVERQLISAGVPADRISVVPDATNLPARLSLRDGMIVTLDSEDPGKGAALLRRTGLSIHFSNDLANDLMHARAFVYITSMEGLGSAALLAMAHGVPVIASNVGGLPEIVRDGETGLLTENNVDSINATIGRLLADDELADRLAAAGRRLVEERFTIERMVDATLSVYRRVLS